VVVPAKRIHIMLPFFFTAVFLRSF